MVGRRGVHPVIGLIIILGVVIAVSIAFAYFGSEIVSYYTGYIEKLKPVSLLKVYANQFEITVANEGTVEERIDFILLNRKQAYVYSAKRRNGSSALEITEDGKYVIIESGETVTIRGFFLERLIPENVYEVRLHSTSGAEFYFPVKAVLAPFETGMVDFNTGVKDL